MTENSTRTIPQSWDVNSYGDDAKKALNAILQGDVEAFRESVVGLPKNYLDDRKIDSKGRTVVHYAALSGDKKFLDILDEKQCSLDVMLPEIQGAWDTLDKMKEKYFPGGVEDVAGNPARTQECLKYALKESDKSFDRAAAIISLMPPAAVNMPMGEDGKTLLHHLCAKAGDIDFIKYLIGRGASLGAVDKEGNTPLHSAACSTGKKAGENMNALLSVCTPEEQNAQNVDGYTPLHAAVSAKNNSTMYELMNGAANIGIACAAGQNVMHVAARKLSNAELVKFYGKVREVVNSRKPAPGVKSGIVECSEALSAYDGADRGGISPIAYAARRHLKCAEDMLRDCLDAGTWEYDVNGEEPNVVELFTKNINVIGETLIHLAVRDTNRSLGDSFSEYVVREAFSRCGEHVFEVKDKAGNTPVHTAAAYSSVDVFREVLECASVAAISTQSHTSGAVTGLLVSNSASSKSALEKLRILANHPKCASVINERIAEGGDVPLVMAYKRGNNAALKALLESSNVDVEAVSRDGLGVFHHAAKVGDTKALKGFIERRERDPNRKGAVFALDSPDDVSPAVYAIREAKSSRVVLRSLKALVGLEPDHGMLLIEAARKGRYDVIDYVTRTCRLNVNSVLVSRDGKQTNVLAEALSTGNLKLAKKFIDVNRASVQEIFGRDTLMTMAVEGGCFDGYRGKSNLKYLVKKGVSLNANVPEGQTNPLVAIMNRYITTDPSTHDQGVGLIRTALSLGADPNAKDANGSTIIHLAVKGSCKNALSWIAGRGGSLTVADANGDTPLHWAARSGNHKMFKSIIRWNSDALVHVNGVDLSSVLHTAARSPEVSEQDLLKMLKEARSHLTFRSFKQLINAQDHNGTTLLHLAAEKGSVKVCKYLMEKHAQLSVVDSEGRTPCDLVPKGSPIRQKGFFESRSTFKEMQRRTVAPAGGFKPYTVPENIVYTEGNAVCICEGRISRKPSLQQKALSLSRNSSVSSIDDSDSRSDATIAHSSLSEYDSDFDDFDDFDDFEEESVYEEPTFPQEDLQVNPEDYAMEEPIYENIGYKRAEATEDIEYGDGHEASLDAAEGMIDIYAQSSAVDAPDHDSNAKARPEPVYAAPDKAGNGASAPGDSGHDRQSYYEELSTPSSNIYNKISEDIRNIESDIDLQLELLQNAEGLRGMSCGDSNTAEKRRGSENKGRQADNSAAAQEEIMQSDSMAEAILNSRNGTEQQGKRGSFGR